MTAMADRYTTAIRGTIESASMPWSIAQLGARAEYRFTSPAPRTGGESAAAANAHLDEYFHLYLANRGVLLTPFHNMALMCPTTSPADVDLHTRLFAEAVAELAG
jgi:glutamate-1-semialdehyde 2,1-aminomutase